MKAFCPLIRGKCKEADCLWWIHVRGLHPQTGAELDQYDCSMRWLPVLLIENAKEVRQGAAATESFRNQMVLGLRQLPMVAIPPKQIGDS